MLLDQTGRLELAAEELVPDSQQIATELRLSLRKLQKANGMAYQFKGDPDLIELAKNIRSVTEAIYNTLAD